jgi:RNA polymerase sigma-70 factor (ECF subfamily)
MTTACEFGRPGNAYGLPAVTSPCEKSEGVSIEHELLARALDGDGRAFATLVEPHLPMLYRIAARACGSTAIAEDAVQETLTLFHGRLTSYSPGTSLRSFLAAIAVRQARTLLRGEQRRRVREDNSAPPEAVADPVELLAAERLGRQIRDALGKMPKKRQEVALLRLDAGLSYAEIAEAVGSTEGSARVLVHLALQQLRELLADLNVEET